MMSSIEKVISEIEVGNIKDYNDLIKYIDNSDDIDPVIIDSLKDYIFDGVKGAKYVFDYDIIERGDNGEHLTVGHKRVTIYQGKSSWEDL